jgi:hypothetical protein
MSDTPTPDPFLTPERLPRLTAQGFLQIRTVPQGGAALVLHKLTPPDGKEDVFAFLLRLSRPEWAGWTTEAIYDGVEALIYEGIAQRRATLGISDG